MANIFTTVQVEAPPRNTFDLTHDVKFSAQMGKLLPCLVMECLPGDEFNISADQITRLAPLTSPVMHRINSTIHYFFVPNRLVWSQWADFISNNIQVVHPYIRLTSSLTADQKKFLDYMGVPVPALGESDYVDVNAIPLAAYQLIYNEYYRDQNLLPNLNDNIQLEAGDNQPQLATLCTQRNRAWEHDYFTSALPFPQKGPDVTLPLGTVNLVEDSTGMAARLALPGDPAAYIGTEDIYTNNDGELTTNSGGTPSDNPGLVLDPDGTLEVGATTINALRLAVALQKFLEKMARGGSRYIEVIWQHFRKRSSDARLQRPEYMTGTKSPIVISEVLSTTPTDEIPQGNMAGHGVGVNQGHMGNFTCEEHGFIIGIFNVQPKTAYQQGLHRMWSKKTYFDFAWPTFANLGEQEILNKEIYLQSDTTAGGTGPLSNNGTFGYIPRYSEYKYMNSRVAGDFRNELDFWHLGRKFANLPTLSQTFIECTPEQVDRVFAVTDPDVDNLYCHILHKISVRRALPVYGTPQL